MPNDLIERERRNARLAYEAGVPTWRVDEPAASSAGRSVVGSFEAGRPLSSILRWRPHRALPLIRRMARLHAQIHATPPDATFDKKSVSAEGALRRLRRLAPETDFDRVPQLIGASESGFCHGDLSPSNVLWDGERLLALDWARSGFGALTADAGRTAAIIFSSRRIGTPAPAPVGRAYRRLLATEYMAAYCAETGRSLDEVRAWAAVFLESKATSGPDIGRRAGLIAEIVRLVQPAAAAR